MKKVIVIGCCGSGKSTFARHLHACTGIPLFHLDQLNWNTDKTTVEKTVFLKRVKVNSFKEFFSKNQKAFNSEIKTSTSLMTNRCFQNYMINFLSCLYKQILKQSLQEQLQSTLYLQVMKYPYLVNLFVVLMVQELE